MRLIALLAAAAASISTSSAGAQKSPQAAQVPSAITTYIHTGRLLDRPGRPPRGPSTIIVRAGRIAEVREGLVAAPAGAALIDLSDRYVLPGLIDSHVHLDSDAGGTAGLVETLTTGEAAAAFRGVANARKTLDAGFTTVRNLGGPGAILALRDAIRDGIVPGPRIVDAGASISGTSGHGDATLSLREELHPAIPQDNLCDGADSCRRAVRLQVRRGADVIKMLVTGGVNSPIGAGLGRQMFDDEVRAIVDTAHM